jgi:anaerobic selenocysteine-containing dehydrogenase
MTFKKIQEPANPFESVLRTTCGNCPAGCGLKVFLKGGKVTDIFGDEEHPINKGSLCPKGLLSYFHLNNPSRLTQPRIRESLQKPFRAVNWQEAIEFTAGKLRQVVEEKGKDSVVIFGSETDPFDYLAGATGFASRFKTSFTPDRFFPRSWGENGLIRKMFGVPAAQLQTNTPRDWCNSRCILLYCCDPATSDPITFGPILDARDRGAVLLTIDTKGSVTSSKATMSLRVRPGSQSVLLNGILRLLISREFVDADFISEWTEDFQSLKSQVEPYTPEKISQLCGIASTELERFVEYLGKSPVQVIAGDWSSRKFLSDADLCGCAAISCLKGSIGIPGGGVNFLGVSPFSSMRQANDKNGEVADISLERLMVDRAGYISSLFWYGNPRAALTGGKYSREALDKVPLIVHLSSYHNETCEHAHVSIPMSSWLEYDGLLATNNGRAIQCHKKVVDPPGQCRSPLEFWMELAGAIGLSLFGEGEEANGNAKIYDSLLRHNPLTGAITFAGLDPNAEVPGGILWPCTDPSQLQFESSRFVKGTTRGLNILFQRNRDYLDSGRRFPTPSGKVCFPMFASGDAASLETGSVRNLPLMLTTGVRVDYVEEYAGSRPGDDFGSRQFVKINPMLAKSLGIKKDDALVIAGAAGQVNARACISDDVAPDVLFLAQGPVPETEYSGPMSLFDLPAEGNTPECFARVTVFKTGSDREATTKKIAELLAS